jgi:ferredoxin
MSLSHPGRSSRAFSVAFEGAGRYSEGGLRWAAVGAPIAGQMSRQKEWEARMKAAVDATLCTGCGLCVDTCPEVFEMGDDTARVIADPVPGAAAARAKQAAEECPVEAITITE